MMLGTKSGVGKLLKDKFLDIILWHCLNHRLELAIGITLEIIGGTNDFQSLFEHLYSLYSQSPKNRRELEHCSHDLQTTLKRIASSFRAVSAVWHSFPVLAQHLTKLQMTKRGKAQKRPDFEAYCPNFAQ